MNGFVPVSTVRTSLLLRIAVAAAFYTALVQLLSWFIATHSGSRWSPLAAMAPILIAMAGAGAVMSRLTGRDEREYRMHLEALAFAFLASQMVLPTYVFAVYIGLVKLTLGTFMPMMVLLWVVGLARAMWKYR